MSRLESFAKLTTQSFAFAVVGDTVDATDGSTASANVLFYDSVVSEFLTSSHETAQGRVNRHVRVGQRLQWTIFSRRRH